MADPYARVQASKIPLRHKLLYGLHEQDWRHTSCRAHLPLRVDGVVTRTGSGLQPLRLQETEHSQLSGSNSRAHRDREGISTPAGQLPFNACFPQSCSRRLTSLMKEKAAADRVEIGSSTTEVSRVASCHTTQVELHSSLSSHLMLEKKELWRDVGHRSQQNRASILGCSLLRTGAQQCDGFCEWQALQTKLPSAF